MPPQRRGIRWRTHFGTLGTDFCRACLQLLLSLALLPHQAWNMGDAIVRSLWRMTVSHRHLLEWTTAAQSSSRPLSTCPASYRQMAGGTALALAGAVGLLALTANWPRILPLLLLWLGAPILALYSSQPPRPARRLSLSPADAEALRLLARRTWRFFETFVTPADNLLPPDNFQEQPKPVLAHRTSPTNIGLYLLSTVAARFRLGRQLRRRWSAWKRPWRCWTGCHAATGISSTGTPPAICASSNRPMCPRWTAAISPGT